MPPKTTQKAADRHLLVSLSSPGPTSTAVETRVVFVTQIVSMIQAICVQRRAVQLVISGAVRTSAGQISGEAISRVPHGAIRTRRPGKVALESNKHVEKGPSANHGVVQLTERNDGDDRVPETLENRRQSPVHFVHSNLSVLAQRLLHEQAGYSHCKQHDGVGNQEGSTAIAVADIRKPPYVPQPHGQAQRSEKKLAMVTPLFSLWIDFLIIFFQSCHLEWHNDSDKVRVLWKLLRKHTTILRTIANSD